ncbi:MAG: hypothetical protein ACTS73_03730 [Arsenophonus sp. NEOnobi-MAG3]
MLLSVDMHLWLQRYRSKIPFPNCKKTFNKLSESPLARNYIIKINDLIICDVCLNSLTLRESAKQTGIDLKIAFIWRYCFLASSSIANINVLSGILEVNEIYFSESFKWNRYIPHRKLENAGDGR